MAKVSPVSIKYMIHASFSAEGALEKPDVIGAVFGQTEGLLGADLEMRELQKEGKIGRIEVDLERKDRITIGRIQIPTALDQSETTLIAAAIETIERIGPCDAQIEVERIEDVRGSKRDYILERAKKLMQQIQGSTDSREISNEIKGSIRTSEIQEYGEEKLPCGDLSSDELIVVEGRADVVNLLKCGVKNVIGMNGTKLPKAIKELAEKKEVTLFVDGDRGGKLIAKNVYENAPIKYIITAPDGKEVEELAGKEILMTLRKKMLAKDFFNKLEDSQRSNSKESSDDSFFLDEEQKEKLKELTKKNNKTSKALLLNKNLEIFKEINEKSLSRALNRLEEIPYIIIVDGQVNETMLKNAENAKCKVLVANNFKSTNTRIQLLSF
jgi:DNA primase